MPTSLRKFLSTPLFSWRAKCRLIREPFIRRSDPKQEESLAEFVRRRLGREFLDYAINPFVSGIYAGAPERLSVYHAFRKLYDLEQRYGSLIRGQILGARERKKRGTQSKQSAPQFSFAEGLQTLTEGLRHRLGSAVRLQSPARRLQRVNGGWRVGTDGDASAEGGSSFHEAVVLAAPAYELARIEVENLSVPSLDFLEEIYYSPVSSLVLGFRREDVAHPLNGFGMLIPKVEPFKILGTLFSSSLFPGRAPEGHVTLTNYIGGVRAPELAAVKLEELIEMTCRDLSILLGVKGKPVFVHHAYFRKAIPQYDVGYGRFQNRMDEIERTCPGIYFGGNYRGGISLSDSILSGLNLAERIKNDLNPCPTEPVTHA